MTNPSNGVRKILAGLFSFLTYIFSAYGLWGMVVLNIGGVVGLAFAYAGWPSTTGESTTVFAKGIVFLAVFSFALSPTVYFLSNKLR